MTVAAPPTRRSGPFPGLAAFTEQDADWFFGREEAAAIVVDNLLAYPISVLFAKGGSGKSSLLAAGVLPLLASEEPRDVVIVCSRWAGGSNALRAQALGLLGEDAPAHADVPLRELVSTTAANTGGRLLIILDQFEELFARGEQPDQELTAAIAGASPAAHVLISIRDDALAKLDRFEGAVPGLFDHLIELEALDMRDGRAAIERPAAAWNAATGDDVVLAPELIDAVLEQVRDVGAEGERRPLNASFLQLVLARLWETELTTDRRTLDLAALQRQGGKEE